MNKMELIRATAKKSGLTQKNVEIALDGLLDVITETLQGGEKIKLVGFGNFDVKNCAERIGRNPRNLQKIVIPATRVAQFTPGKLLKDAVAEYSGPRKSPVR